MWGDDPDFGRRHCEGCRIDGWKLIRKEYMAEHVEMLPESEWPCSETAHGAASSLWNRRQFQRGECARPLPALSAAAADVLEVFSIVESQVTIAFDRVVSLFWLAAARVADDLGIDTSGSFWPLFKHLEDERLKILESDRDRSH